MPNFLELMFGRVLPRRDRGFPRVGHAVLPGESRELAASESPIWMNFSRAEPNKQPFGTDWALRSFVACLTLPWLMFPAFVYLSACLGEFDPNDWDTLTTGDAAKDEIRQVMSIWRRESGPSPELPASAKDFCCFESGGWDGTAYYWSFECDTIEECWAVMKSQSAEGTASFKPWSPSEYAAVMLGPGRFGPAFATPKWDVRTIEEGVCFERVEGDRSIEYVAIDFRRRRVFGYMESGGFSRAKYRGPVPRVAHGGWDSRGAGGK